MHTGTMFVVPKRKKERPDFTQTQWGEINKICAASSCRVLVFKGKEGYLGVHIEFTGELTHFPSTSNDRQIFYRHYIDKRTGQRKCAPFNGRSVESQVKLRAMKEMFARAILSSGHSLPCFLDERVRITGLFAAKAGRWDVHNQIKPMCDWVQDIGMINDDVHARAMAERKDDWPQAYPDWAGTTTIIIQPESGIGSLIPATIGEMKAVSTGALKLVG